MRRAAALIAALTLAVLAGLVSAPAADSALVKKNCAAPAKWGKLQPALEEQVLVLLNVYRAEKGLSKLDTNFALRSSARWKSLHMGAFNYFGHEDTPIKRSTNDRISDCGYSVSNGWGENLAHGQGSAAEVMKAWIASPGHKKNLETAWFRTVGIGVSRSADGTLYWTQNFGGK